MRSEIGYQTSHILKFVALIAFASRYDGWVTEMQEEANRTDTSGPSRGIDNLLYSADACKLLLPMLTDIISILGSATIQIIHLPCTS